MGNSPLRMTMSEFEALTIEQVEQKLAENGEIRLYKQVEQEYASITPIASENTPDEPETDDSGNTDEPEGETPQPQPDLTLDANGQMLFKAPSQIDDYVDQYPELTDLAKVPVAKWFGEWVGNVWSATNDYVTAAANAGKKPVIVAYNIPHRDNGNYSSGGVANNDEYYAWIGAMADAIGNRHAMIILEPDALGLTGSMSAADKQKRIEAIGGAVSALKAKPNVEVYIDASMWVAPADMATLLQAANVSQADGFSLNVSGYKLTSDCETYGEQLSSMVYKPYVIDTSRNGNGEWDNPNNEADPWANPPGRKIGHLPTTNVNAPNCDWYLWIKAVGESDGAIRGWGSAGTFEPQLAINYLYGI